MTYHVAAATAAGTYSNTASATSTEVTTPASDTKSLTVTSDVALQVTKTFVPPTIVAGSGDHTFTIAVQNTGKIFTAHNVHVTDSVNPSLLVTAVHDDQGDTSCTASAGGRTQGEGGGSGGGGDAVSASDQLLVRDPRGWRRPRRSP